MVTQGWWGSFEPKDIATLIIALYGAVLSSINAAVSFNKEMRRLKIEIDGDVIFYSATENPDDAKASVVLRVANVGTRSVVVRDVTLAANGKSLDYDLVWLSLLGTHQQLPKQVADGEAVVFYVGLRDLEDVLASRGYTGTVSITPGCRLETGKEYFGSTWTFDVKKKITHYSAKGPASQ